MSEDDIKFEDGENYSFDYNKDKISFREIILQHLRKIFTLASVEYRGGGYEERTLVSNGVVNSMKVYIPDTREVYSNAIEVMADGLLPYYDSDMEKAEKKYQEQLDLKFKDIDGKRGDDLDYNMELKSEYRDTKRILSRDLFRALCEFLYRKKYLDIGVVED